MPASFRFDHRDFPVSLQAILASLEEHFPSEINIVDFCEVTCHTKRAETILSALTEDAPRLEIEQIPAPEPTTVEMYHAAQIADKQQVEPAHKLERVQPGRGEATCAECGNVFTPKNKASKYCSDACMRRATNRHYREAHKGNNGSDNADPETLLGQSRLLDPDTGEIRDRQDVLASIREGKYPIGKRFRRSHNRLYEVVEQDRNGHPRLALKQVFDPLPIA